MSLLQRCAVRSALIAHAFPQLDFPQARDLIAFLYFYSIYVEPSVQRRVLPDFAPVVERFHLEDWFDQSVHISENPEHLKAPGWLGITDCAVIVADAMIISGIDITHVEVIADWNQNWREFAEYDDLETGTKTRLQTIAENLVAYGEVEKCSLQMPHPILRRPRRLAAAGCDIEQTLKLLPLRAILAYDLHCVLNQSAIEHRRQILKTHFRQEFDAVAEIVFSDMPATSVLDQLSAVPSKYSTFTPEQQSAMQALDPQDNKPRAMLLHFFDIICYLVKYLTTKESDDADILVRPSIYIYCDNDDKVLGRLLHDRLGTFPNLGKAVDRELCDW